MICSWSGGGSLEVDLHHCQEPVNYHLFFKQSGSSSYENFTLKKGDEQKLYDSNAGSIKIKVTKLERTENIVTTSVSTMPIMPFSKLMKKFWARETISRTHYFYNKKSNY